MNSSEQKRILDEYQIIDTPIEEIFDDFVALATETFDVPIAFISFLDEKRQWFKSISGLDAQNVPLDETVCGVTMHSKEDIVVIEDLSKDSRFSHLPFVDGNPNLRFYAGYPLRSSEGIPIGTMCLLDHSSKTLTEKERNFMLMLGKGVMHLLESRRKNEEYKQLLVQTNLELTDALNSLLEAQEIAHLGSFDWDLTTNQVVWTEELYNLFGVDPNERGNLSTEEWHAMVEPDDLDGLKSSLRAALREGRLYPAEFRLNRPNGTQIWIRTKWRIDQDEKGKVYRMIGTAHDISVEKEGQKKRESYIESLESMLFSLSHELRKPLASCKGMLQALAHDGGLEDVYTPQEVIEKLKTYISDIDEELKKLTLKVHTNKGSM
ncbi:MAG: PAS domain-containing protein [Crocinitomicaceae bacterium]|jgi:PAS domain-containing protein|nr:PAS domain-containing protein [Crocinitomicaceae bacterium]